MWECGIRQTWNRKERNTLGIAMSMCFDAPLHLYIEPWFVLKPRLFVVQALSYFGFRFVYVYLPLYLKMEKQPWNLNCCCIYIYYISLFFINLLERFGRKTKLSFDKDARMKIYLFFLDRIVHLHLMFNFYSKPPACYPLPGILIYLFIFLIRLESSSEWGSRSSRSSRHEIHVEIIFSVKITIYLLVWNRVSLRTIPDASRRYSVEIRRPWPRPLSNKHIDHNSSVRRHFLLNRFISNRFQQ